MTPRGWTTTVLGEIGEYLNGRGFKKSEWRESGRPIIRIQNLTGSGGAFNYYDGPADERYTARSGDILMSWAATLGVYVWRGPEAVVNQHIFKVESRIDADFHRYLLEAVLGDLRRQTHGSGMVHITRPKFLATEVPLPPLAEQRRIVAAIEEQFSRLEDAESQLMQAAARLTRLREGILGRALAGPWETYPLSKLLHSLRNGAFVSRPAVTPPGTPILRISAVRPLLLDVDDVRYAPAEIALTSYLLNEDDLLFTRYSGNAEYVGACARVKTLPRPTAYPDKLIRATVDRSLADPAFVELACSAGLTRQAIRDRRKTTAGQVGIAGGQLRSVPVPMPPLDEQRRIVAEVERHLSVLDAMAAAIESAQRRSAALRRSILERAFRGELVPQDPSDEPASVLLERIRAEREANPRPRRARRAGSARSS